MARGLMDGLLRFCQGAWRDNDGDAVDIVELVRCKDCKHRDEAGCCTPPIISAYGYDHLEPKDNDYCSYGERKDND